MKTKPADDQENLSKCICRKCSLFTICNQEKRELLFCARKKSACEMDAKKLCICGSCPVFQENDLEGGYFCINEIKE